MIEFLIQNNVVCHAVEAMFFASVACSILGVIITQLKISSIGFTMAHAAFAGAAVGMFFGLDSRVSAVALSILIAIMIGPLSDRAKMPEDTILGVLFGMLMAIAIFFIAYMQYIGKGFSASSLLFGDVISLYRGEIYGLAVVSVVAILFVVLFYKEISAVIFDKKIAEAAGVQVKPIYYALLFMIAFTVALSLNIVGGLLLYVWLITPAAIAYQFMFDVKGLFVMAPVIAGVISISGALAGLEYSLPVGPLTAVLFSVIFVFSVIFSRKRRISHRKE